MLKKIKVLVLDDNPKSMEAVIRCSLPYREDFVHDDEVSAAISGLLDVCRCSSVTEAIEATKKHKPDIVFTDLLLKNNDESNPDVLKYPYQGLYFVKWLKENIGHKLIIKVHSQYISQDEVEEELCRQGLGFLDCFHLLEEDDFISLDKLKRRLPEFLKAIARNYWRDATPNAEMRQYLHNILKKHCEKNTLDEGIKDLDYFSVRTLMAGWMSLDFKDGQLVLNWQQDATTALEALTSQNRTSIPTNSPKTKLDEFVQKPGYPALFDKAQEQALHIVQAFVKAWTSKLNENIPRLNSPWLEGATQNIEAIKQNLPDTKMEEVYIKTFRFRLVIGGLHALREHFDSPIRERIVDYAILACIRNSPMEAKEYEKYQSQVRKHLSVYGLGQISEPTGYQKLKEDAFYDKEKVWLAGIENKLGKF